MSDPDTYEITIPSDTSKGHEVQDEILRLLDKNQFPDRDVFGIKLALEEAIVNAIKHGNGMDPAKQVFVRCQIDHERVEIIIEDQGAGFDPSDVPDPTDEENLDKPSGRGLMLMRAFMTSVHFNESGNRITLEKVRTLDEE